MQPFFWLIVIIIIITIIIMIISIVTIILCDFIYYMKIRYLNVGIK